MFAKSQGLRLMRPDGRVTTDLATFPDSRLTIGRVVSSGHEIAVREADRLTVLMPRSGQLSVGMGGTRHVLRPGEPAAFRPGERVTSATPDRSGRFMATTLQIPMERVLSVARSLEVPSLSAFRVDVVPMRNRVGATFLHRLAGLVDDIFVGRDTPLPDKVMRAIEAWVDEELLAMIDGEAEDRLLRIIPAFHRVRQAEEIMRAHWDEPLSMLDLAQQLGVSLRSLQLAFKLVHDGKSPRDYFNRVRLEQARVRLMLAKDSENVTTIAVDCGFFHLGRFSQTYARVFGERPSDTLARRRA